MNREHPILFSTEMVQALLEGRKTKTRRAVKSPTGLFDVSTANYEPDYYGYYHNKIVRALNDEEGYVKDILCPYGQVGDILWVRENWFPAAINGNKVLIAHDVNNPEEAHEIITDDPSYYWAKMERARLIPSIHMPREACRIRLQITDIKVERIQQITEEDAKAEGAPHERHLGKGVIGGSHREGFINLWEKINGAESWEQNPWVWVVSFSIISPEGAVKRGGEHLGG